MNTEVIDCPECRQGKHVNCTVTVLCEDDNWRACPCAARGHDEVKLCSPRRVDLTYTGTSGHSGTDTSKERAKREDGTGVTQTRQFRIRYDVSMTGSYGMTVKELRNQYPHLHHGQISSALTNLHRAGHLCRLVEERQGCKVYVTPPYVMGRETEKYVTRKERREAAGEGKPFPRTVPNGTALGPDCLLSEDGDTISYQGENYYRSPM